jgi:hypothetical protein
MSLEQAVTLSVARQERSAHPDGTFDKKSRWYPSESEQQPCCSRIRYPSAAFPNSLNRHCRSAGHVATLAGVDASELRRAARRATA